jgi:hypothetical protein
MLRKDAIVKALFKDVYPEAFMDIDEDDIGEESTEDVDGDDITVWRKEKLFPNEEYYVQPLTWKVTDGNRTFIITFDADYESVWWMDGDGDGEVPWDEFWTGYTSFVEFVEETEYDPDEYHLLSSIT